MAYLLGLDISTTGAKALLMDERGNVIAGATTEYPLSNPRPLWSEQSPANRWQGARTSIRGALQKAGLRGEEVSAVGLTGQMHGLVMLDASGRILRPAILGMTGVPVGNVPRSPRRSAGWADCWHLPATRYSPVSPRRRSSGCGRMNRRCTGRPRTFVCRRTMCAIALPANMPRRFRTPRAHLSWMWNTGAAFDAAILAGVGGGIYASVEDALALTVHITDRIAPIHGNVERCQALEGVYRSLYPALRPSFHDLARLYS